MVGDGPAGCAQWDNWAVSIGYVKNEPISGANWTSRIGVRPLSMESSRLLWPQWMHYRTSSSGHGKSEIRLGWEHPHLRCGTINLDWRKAGFPKVRSLCAGALSRLCTRLIFAVDPREAIGYCAGVLQSSSPFDGNYPSTATGGVRATLLLKLYAFSTPWFSGSGRNA